MKQTWLITGCSSGLGESLAGEALKQGYNVIVTARNPHTISHFAKDYPDTAFIAQLDVTEAESIHNAVQAGLANFGSLDVLVNNAGYCLRGAVEECSQDEIMREFDVNFFGAVRMIQAVLPIMRKQKKGVIVNLSSIAALGPSAGSAFYGAAKCALEGVSDGLRKEVNPLGIKVIIIEPGPFKTDFFYRSLAINSNNIADYAETAGKRKQKLLNPEAGNMDGWGDKTKAAKVIIQAVENPDPPFRLLLGSRAVKIAEEFARERSNEVARWKELSIKTDL